MKMHWKLSSFITGPAAPRHPVGDVRIPCACRACAAGAKVSRAASHWPPGGQLAVLLKAPEGCPLAHVTGEQSFPPRCRVRLCPAGTRDPS